MLRSPEKTILLLVNSQLIVNIIDADVKQWSKYQQLLIILFVKVLNNPSNFNFSEEALGMGCKQTVFKILITSPVDHLDKNVFKMQLN